jgi:hypothetical protein
MESTNQSSFFELSVDLESIEHLTETARWAKFLAIVGFIMCGLIAIVSFFIGTIFASSSLSGFSGTGAGMGSALGGVFITLVYLVIAVAQFFPCLFLYQFAVRLRMALRTNDQVKLNQSLKSQKFLFRYAGIATIIVLCLYGVGLLIAGVVMVLLR